MIAGDLSNLAKEYIAVVEKIEKTSDKYQLQILEEQRVVLHGQWMDLLNHYGIGFNDREHATRIAIKMAKSNL